MGGTTPVAERVESLRQRVIAGDEEPWRSAYLKIVSRLQLALRALPSPQQELAAEHLQRAEWLTGIQIARLRRDLLPPRPARTSEAALLDRVADLVRLLDLHASDDTLVEYIAGLAHHAAITGDALTLYVMASGPLDPYYQARGVDDFWIRERIVRRGTGDGAALRHALLLGPDGIGALVRELRDVVAAPDVAREIQDARVPAASEPPKQTSFPPLLEGRDLAPLAVVVILLLAVTRYLAFVQPPRVTTVDPTATVVLGLGPATPAPPPTPEPSPLPTVVLATAVGAPSPTSVPSPVPQAPSPTPIPSLIPSPTSVTASAPSPTPIPPTETEVIPPPRVASSGFAQKNQDVSCAFVVQNGGAGSVALSLRYQVIATDGAGATLRTESGSIASIRLGGRVGIASRFSLSPGQTIAHCALQLTPVATPSASPPPLVTSDVVVADAAPLRVAGVISNPSTSVASGVEVHVIAYDASGGAIIGGGTERVGDLTPNSRTRVTVPLIASAPPAEVELYAIPSLPP